MGTLFVVATPIGNLSDLSPRAVETMRSVNVIAAEDTRHSRRLLSHFGIETPMVSYHQHNERERRERLLVALDRGDVALISDAGTPGISDPGAVLVAAALDAGHTVSPIPGPSALAAAISASGLIAGPFLTLGFLPRERGPRRTLIAKAVASGFPLVIFESPNRLRDTLAELQSLAGDRLAVVTRELTKIHEEVRKGTVSDLLEWSSRDRPRGEVTLIISGSQPLDSPVEDAATVVTMLRRSGLSPSQTAREAAAITGLPRSEMYRLASLPRDDTSAGLKRQFPLPDENALQDALGDEECPK
ncbi:MAG: 16S rRNA (cytidine(1402)-2'-O)-methyltransferase [Thermomicrobiales bacterium]